jgi:hypothetical protein
VSIGGVLRLQQVLAAAKGVLMRAAVVHAPGVVSYADVR